MALIALIGASALLDEGGLRALATVAGQTLIERQAARLADVGVERVFVAVGAVPPELLNAFDRIRRQGIAITPVRAAVDLVAAIGPTDRLLLVADGLHASKAHYSAMARAGGLTIMVTGDTALTHGFERIDAQARWGGLALTTPAMIGDVAGLPGEWDLLLTLLRFAVQGGAQRLYCEPALFEQGEITIIADGAMAALLERSSLQQVEYGGIGLGRSVFFMPLVRMSGPLLVRSGATAHFMPVITGALWIGVAVLAMRGLSVASAIAAVLGCLGLASMRYLASFRAENALQDRVRAIIRSGSLILLGLFPWLLALSRPDHLPPILAEAALAPCLALIILLARWLFEEIGDTRRFHWLLPDADQAWAMLVPALIFGFSSLMFVILPFLALFQTLFWLRLAKRPMPHDAGSRSP